MSFRRWNALAAAIGRSNVGLPARPPVPCPGTIPFSQSIANTSALASVEMPVVSRFYGLVIFLNYNDHNPPHFHARYQDQQVTVEIDTGIVTGTMGKRALQLLFDWYEQHQAELMENWNRARDRKPLLPISPLP